MLARRPDSSSEGHHPEAAAAAQAQVESIETAAHVEAEAEAEALGIWNVDKAAGTRHVVEAGADSETDREANLVDDLEEDQELQAQEQAGAAAVAVAEEEEEAADIEADAAGTWHVLEAGADTEADLKVDLEVDVDVQQEAVAQAQAEEVEAAAEAETHSAGRWYVVEQQRERRALLVGARGEGQGGYRTNDNTSEEESDHNSPFNNHLDQYASQHHHLPGHIDGDDRSDPIVYMRTKEYDERSQPIGAVPIIVGLGSIGLTEEKVGVNFPKACFEAQSSHPTLVQITSCTDHVDVVTPGYTHSTTQACSIQLSKTRTKHKHLQKNKNKRKRYTTTHTY